MGALLNKEYLITFPDRIPLSIGINYLQNLNGNGRPGSRKSIMEGTSMNSVLEFRLNVWRNRASFVQDPSSVSSVSIRAKFVLVQCRQLA